MRAGKIGYCIVGTGAIAPWHAAHIAAVPEAELVAAVDRDTERLALFRSRFGIPHGYSSLEDALQDSAVDVVIICTPTTTHAAIAEQAAAAGKHVLSEKPMALTPADADRMIAACRGAGVKLGVILQRRQSDAVLAVKRMLDEKLFGDIVLASAYLKYYRNAAYYVEAPWRGTRTDGGGALMNMGVHGIDLIQWLNGGVTGVFTRAATLARDITVEDTSVSSVTFGNGALGSIEASTLVYPEYATRCELHGTNGTVVFDDNGIVLCRTLAGDIDPAAWRAEAQPAPASGVPAVNHYRFLHDMTMAVLEDRDPHVTGEEAKKSIVVVDAMYRSADSGREIRL
ncbi:Gfo/Idh/MocA family protein [Paenibacillus cymbidii]|uniref:Gfo/Idh/MocA family protein n=1 Tax=Paenibacillus cymbidii TaxID=1639034 RepID=UPI001081AD02|nr:Gfo/Idh/MocA family oxidoreductase [Paenibacillus cymbidii]